MSQECGLCKFKFKRISFTAIIVTVIKEFENKFILSWPYFLNKIIISGEFFCGLSIDP